MVVALGSLVRPALPSVLSAGLISAMAVFVLAGELGMHHLTLPHRRAQVPSAVIGAGSAAGALQFGFEMGTGVRTHMPSNLPYLPLVAVLLVGGWVAALLAGLGFGLGRAAMALGRHHSQDPTWWDGQWQRHARRLRIALSLAAVLLVAVVLVAAAHSSTTAVIPSAHGR